MSLFRLVSQSGSTSVNTVSSGWQNALSPSTRSLEPSHRCYIIVEQTTGTSTFLKCFELNFRHIIFTKCTTLCKACSVMTSDPCITELCALELCVNVMAGVLQVTLCDTALVLLDNPESGALFVLDSILCCVFLQF